MTAISEKTIKMAEMLKGKISIDNDNGVAKTADDTFESTLPEGMTLEMVDSVFDHIKTVSEGFVKATGEAAEEYLKKHKEVEQVSNTLKVGKGMAVDVAYDRKINRRKSVTDPTMIDVYGATSVKMTVKSRTSAEMKRVRDALSESAAKAFG